jgi:hypothetical protein
MEKTTFMKRKLGKRGNILDWFYIIAILFMTGIAILTSYIVITAADDTGLFTDYEEAQTAVDYSKNSILNFDNMMLFVVIGLSIFVLISSALVFNHPSFFIMGFFLLLIAVVFSAIISNSWWTFANQGSIISAASNFPKIRFLMDKLPFYIAFMGIASAIVAYVSYMRQ